MKKIFTLISLISCLSFTGFAQYYYIPHTGAIAANSNPGGLCTDPEQPGTAGAPGWTVFQTTSASAVWSASQTLPFSFSLGGSPVTNYKVSTTGILTFTTSAVSVPGTTSASLPSASIPDLSICIWGLQGTGTNDAIQRKTFGTAPNRQHWIMFCSYSSPGSTGWTYWGIVLEETTNKVYIVDMRTYNAPLSLAVGIQVDSTTAYQVTGSPTLNSLVTNGGNNDFPEDNIFYEFIGGTQPAFDVANIEVDFDPYVAIGDAPFTISGKMHNYGSTAISSMQLNYAVNGASAVTSTTGTISLPMFNAYTFTHPTTWTPSASGSYTVKVWASNLNGSNSDGNNSNDTITKTVFVANALAQRKALIEQFTSSTCAPCAAANPAFNALIDLNGVNTVAGKVVAIKYQMNYPTPGNDPQYTQESTDRHNYYNVGGIPHSNMGNTFDEHTANITQQIIDDEYNRPALFNLNITGTVTGTTLNITATCTSLVDIPSNNLKLHLVVTEDHNSHAMATNGETDFFEVMRKMLPNSSGSSLSSQTESEVSTINQTYACSYSNAPKFLSSNLTVVGFIQDNLTKEIFQTSIFKTTISGVGITEQEVDQFNMNLFPNPASNMVNLDFTLPESADVKIKVVNMLGETVADFDKGFLTAGENNAQISLENLEQGFYFVHLFSGNKSAFKKISVVK